MPYTKNIHFFHDESKQVWKLLSRAADKSRQDHHRVFRDWLWMSVCALSRGEMEESYLKTVKAYGEPGGTDRAIDAICEAFAIVVGNPDKDVLGDVFQGAITFGEAGQFFTPEPVCRLMAGLSDADGLEPGMKVHDPACGSGRTLLVVAEKQPEAVFFGTDVDARCAQMCAINLAIRGLRGVVIHGNSLSLEEWERWFVLQPGGVILPREKFEAYVGMLTEEEGVVAPEMSANQDVRGEKVQQLTLF